MPKTIAVIDGNSLMHRAYHAVPPTMNAPDGTPTNAVFGFMSMLFKFIEVASPDGIVCAFDAGKPKFRMEAMEQYKAQRPPMDDELRVQFPVIESLLESMNIPVVKVQGWEGDDILGTVASRDEARGYKTLLVSGDKDVNQLVTDLTHVVTTKKGITDVVIYDPETVQEKYGIAPEQFPDYLGFMGDTSDNIPGVPGIGPKSAQKLLTQFGSMEGVYENLDKLKGKQLENIRDNRELAFLSRKIATIVTDLDFELDVDEVAWPAFDVQAVTEAFGAIRFSAHLEKLLRLAGQESGVTTKPRMELQQPCEGEDAEALVQEALEQGKRIAVAVSKPAQESLFGCDVVLAAAVEADEPEDAADETGVAVRVGIVEGDGALDLLARIVKEGAFAAHDVKAVVHEVFPRDSAQSALVEEADVLAVNGFDVALAAYVLNSSAGKYPLATLCSDYLDIEMPEAKDEKEGAAIQAQVVLALAGVLEEKLSEDDEAGVYRTIDLPLVGVLAVMERNGVPIDAQALADLGASTQQEIDALKERIYELAGEEFNVDSPKQLGHILFEVLGLPHGKKTQRGYSTDAQVLKKLSEIHDLPATVLHYREFAKIKSTYIDALPLIARKYDDGRVHTSFNETVTATGRLSSSDPNLQNIPVRTDFGRKIRACFGAIGEDDVFLSADYSQIELRLLAHLSGDEHLVAAFNSGADFHASTAARVFGVPVEEVSPQMRSRAKAVNFGIVYGQQAFGLAQSLEISMAEAKEMIDRYFEAYPGVRAYLDDAVKQAKERGYAETMFGRRRYIPELAARNAVQRGFGERTAMNHPMQGSAADIIKLAMNEVARRLLDEGFESKLLLQVHDELDFSVPIAEVERLSAMVKDVMESAAELKVPLIADVSYGATWAEAH
ncbi:MAG: DNA polymerase I [Eggerthellaceae bacterium]|nr:DNA polymerase I [Eggerthellaceae bacterium]